jgi:hypothetical protein
VLLLLIMIIIIMTVARGVVKMNVRSGQRLGLGIPHIPKILTLWEARGEKACGKFQTESRRP